MKRIIKSMFPMLAIAAALAATGCTEPVDTGYATDAGGGLAVSFDIPEMRNATRANVPIEEGMISSMWMMLFNENGNFISRHEGVRAEGNLSNYIFRSVPASDKARTLHFVANYDWSGFDDVKSNGSNESEVVRGMNVSGGVTAYWQRVTLPDGIEGTVDNPTGMVLTEPVHLLRNVAQIVVTNNTVEEESALSLTDVQFAVGDRLDMGSVAPFDAAAGTFGEGVSEAMGGSRLPLDETGFVLASQPGVVTGGGAIDVYESRNSTATRQTYIIIKAKFQKTKANANTDEWSYYKLDICLPQATELLDIRRNKRYIINLNVVAFEGYPTLEEAVANVATNNINAAVEVSDYTAVSDGQNVLRVENTAFTYVKADQSFQIRYAYIKGNIDGTTGATDNSKVEVTLRQDENKPVVKTGTFAWSRDNTTPWVNGLWTRGAVISGTTAAIPATEDIYRAYIDVMDGRGVLSRTIQLRLRPAMNFQNVFTTPENGVTAQQIGEHITINFSFPADISPTLFPMPVYITTKRFSPDASKNQLAYDMSVSEFRYVYYASYLLNGDGTPWTHTLHFISNSPNTVEDVKISADIFNDSVVSFNDDTDNRFAHISNFAASPNGAELPAEVGQPVALSFAIPTDMTGYDAAAPYTFRIFTSKLEYVSADDTAATCVWNAEMECYEYTTSATGTHTVRFVTKEADSSETVFISADRFSSAYFTRTCNL